MEPTIVMARSHSNMIIRDNGMVLEIRNVQASSSGRYHCIASNIVGEGSKHFNLEVYCEYPSL